MKELEAKIAGLDFDIEQEKQRSYTFLDADKIESYLNSVICGDIQEMPVRKLIVKTFVREVILDNDSVTITYNFTENYTKYKITPETLQQIKRQSIKKTANHKTLCSNKLPSLPPQGVAFEHAALLLLLKRRCRYRVSNKTISNKAIKPLFDAKKRYARQLYKITEQTRFKAIER